MRMSRGGEAPDQTLKEQSHENEPAARQCEVLYVIGIEYFANR